MVNPELDELNLLHAHVCQALEDPKRLLILYAIHEKPRRVSILAEDLGMPQPTVSRHLSILRQRQAIVVMSRQHDTLEALRSRQYRCQHAEGAITQDQQAV